MNNTVLLAVIFPANLPYFSAFLHSVKQQSDSQFDILIANDGVTAALNLEELKNIAVIPVQGSPLETRLALLQSASERGYEKFIFADTDDELSENRIAVLKELLDEASCVCNDVDLIDVKGQSIAEHYWSGRINNSQLVDSVFLADKNIIGFGNVGLTSRALLAMKDFIPTNVPAPDWLYFYVLATRSSAIFTSRCTTRYRQHSNNLIGIKSINEARLFAILDAKKKHYDELAGRGFDTRQNLDKILMLQQRLSNPDAIREAINRLSALNINYFWWEETNYLV